MSTEAGQQTQQQLGWKTTPYILGNEVSERIASYGLTWSMILYFIEKYHMKKEEASYRLSIISGITALAPIVGGFVADAYLGRYRTILYASISNLLGMSCLLLTSLIPTLTPPPCNDGGPCVGASTGQLYFLYATFVFLAVGSGGLRPCVYAFGADQFKQDTMEDKKQLQSFFNWYYVCLSFALLLASTILSYIQLEVSWKWGFGIPTMMMALSILIFIGGSFSYTCVSPKGSPFTELAQVLVAAYKKRRIHLPIDSTNLYHGDYGLYDNPCKTSTCNNLLDHTNGYRFLDKAAVRTQEDQEEEEEAKGVHVAPKNKWRLCEVDKVEAVKCVLRVGPIWAAGILPGSYLIQQGIWLPLQAQTMERHVGRLVVPATSMPLFSFLTLVMWLPFYDRVVVPRLRWDGLRGVSLLQRTGIGYGLTMFSPLLGGLVEAQRRQLAASGHRQMSVFWLAPQLMVLGLADSFCIVGLIEFLYDQMPARMRSTAVALFATALAFGSFAGSGLLALLQHASRWAHHRPWIQEDLDEGQLDYYYYFLAVTLAVNFVYFVVVARKYKYRSSPASLPRSHLRPPDADLAAISHISAYFSASVGGDIDQASFSPARFASPSLII